MKKIIFTSLLMLGIFGGKISAQQAGSPEFHGNTLNLGLGIGYYGYVNSFMPVVHANYEIQAARNFTLAPFITVFSYRSSHYWGNPKYPENYYYYRQTVIPVGVKGTYYFDKLLNLNSKWDLYAAGSLGFAFRSTRWDNGYDGNVNFSHSTSGLYLDGHIGAEFHAGQNLGIFLDLSSGLSTVGLAFHL